MRVRQDDCAERAKHLRPLTSEIAEGLLPSARQLVERRAQPIERRTQRRGFASDGEAEMAGHVEKAPRYERGLEFLVQQIAQLVDAAALEPREDQSPEGRTWPFEVMARV